METIDTIHKILSIDFDFIMAPCIKLYNSMCGGDENPTVSWNRIEAERNIQNFLEYDANYLSYIAKLIKNNVQNGATLIPIKEHQELVKPIMENPGKIDLVNIDFHHDVLYGDHQASIVDMDKYNYSNWVFYLYSKNKLNSCTWVRAPQSDPLMENIEFHFDGILPARDLKTLGNNFEFIYFCLSPQWVPFKFHHLYDLIIDLCRKG